LAAQQLGRIWRATTAGQNGKLSAGGGDSARRSWIAGSNNVNVPRGNDANGIGERNVADEVINDAVLLIAGFGNGLVAIGSELTKDLVQTRAAQVAVNEKNAMSLLGE